VALMVLPRALGLPCQMTVPYISGIFSYHPFLVAFHYLVPSRQKNPSSQRIVCPFFGATIQETRAFSCRFILPKGCVCPLLHGDCPATIIMAFLSSLSYQFSPLHFQLQMSIIVSALYLIVFIIGVVINTPVLPTSTSDLQQFIWRGFSCAKGESPFWYSRRSGQNHATNMQHACSRPLR